MGKLYENRPASRKDDAEKHITDFCLKPADEAKDEGKKE